jgi:hypothetical protein
MRDLELFEGRVFRDGVDLFIFEKSLELNFWNLFMVFS